MERFFKVTNSAIGIDYMKFKENRVKINDLFKILTKEFNISATQYHVSNTDVAIIPIDYDLKNFKSSFLKIGINEDLRFFRKNSAVVKRWLELLKENDVQVLTRPRPSMYFDILGPFSSRLFLYKGEVYLSINSRGEYVESLAMLDDMKIKGSEFYKVIEEMNGVKEDE